VPRAPGEQELAGRHHGEHLPRLERLGAAMAAPEDERVHAPARGVREPVDDSEVAAAGAHREPLAATEPVVADGAAVREGPIAHDHPGWRSQGPPQAKPPDAYSRSIHAVSAPRPKDEWPLPETARTEAATVVGLDAPSPAKRRVWDDNLALGLGALLVLVLLGAGAAYALTHRGHHPAAVKTVVVTRPPSTTAAAQVKKIAMPLLVGAQRADAAARLRRLGLAATVVTRPSSQPAGIVIAQSPGQAASLHDGQPVRLVVSSGQAKVTVPSLVGEPLATARTRVAALKLSVQTTSVTSTKHPGTVVDQAPKPGRTVAKGGVVTLSVAKAPAGATTTAATATTTAAAPQPTTATVPDVGGQDEVAAVQAFAQAGLLPSLVFVAASDPLGTVESQAKPGGTTVPARSHVQITISRGAKDAPMERMPRVTGDTLQQALAAVNGAHLRLIYVKIAVPRAQAGTIVQQSPLPGGGAPQNAQVLVFLGVYRP
jgi:beta-lactam-binding protein with PASTA domain